MAYGDLYKNRFGSTKGMDRGYVFGTFPNGNLSYDVKNFERERDDGTTIIDLVPECRVFVFGTEVTKDVQSVSVNHSLSGNKCTIRLTNPRDRYVVTKQDLVGNWREDKDFLATYDYDYLKRIPPSRPDLLQLLTQNKKIGKYGYSLSDQIAQFSSFFKPTQSPVSRMIFETKFYSGITKRVGDILFDYRDPVMVFMKGRFSPYWYFAFTGVIESWDEVDTYSSEQSVSLKCEDPLYFLKREKFANRSSLIAAGNYESATRNNHSSNRTNIFEKKLGAGDTSLEKAVAILFFGSDHEAQVKDCHPITSSFNNKSIKDADTKDFDKIRKILEEDYSIGKLKAKFNFKETESDLMLTSGQNPSRWWWATGKKPTGYVIPVNKIGSNGVQDGKLNDHPFGPWQSLYCQLNIIRLSEFNGTELMARYSSSVRYWEVTPQIGSGNVSPTDAKHFNGWADSGAGGNALAIGTAGIHPAMTYEFINHFNILPGIWEQLFTGTGKNKEPNKALNKLNVSPHEKIRELVAGSSTENRPNPNVKQGSNVNLFRPRVFAVIPKKFTDKNRAIMTTVFGQLSLLNQSVSTTYDTLKEMCSAIQFSFFASPMGDIFIEPEMHDFHPTEMLIPKDVKDSGQNDTAKIEERSIIEKKKTVKFRALNTGADKNDILDTAYMYNSKANHPFFLMEKDRIRCTQSFKPENIKTHITVIGSVTGKGGVVDAKLVEFAERQAALFGSSGYDAKQSKGFSAGIYVADGFGFKIDRINMTVSPLFVDARVNYLTLNYKKTIWSNFLETEYNKTFEAIFKATASSVRKLAKSNFDETASWNVDLLTTVKSLELLGQFNEADTESRERYGISLTRGELTIIDYFARNTLNAMASTQTLKKNKTGGVDAVQAAEINNSVSSNPFAEIVATSTVKKWLQSATQEKFAKVTAKQNDQIKKRKSRLDNFSETIRAELVSLFEPTAIDTITEVKQAYEEIYALEQSKNEKIVTPINLGQLKELEKKGIYNPRLDIARFFGYNKGPTIRNVMIDNGAEASRYAVTTFNKLYGKAHTISIDMIGRPELLLNKPYYCERKDAIGLLENYSLKFSVGSDFQTSLTLSYVRKNSLTYKYTLGTLDELVGTTNNAYFSNAAKNYFKSMSSMNNNVSNRVLTKTMSAAGNLVGATVAKGGAGKTLGSKLFKLGGKGFTGGLYTAHDKIGHMEYDLLGIDSKVSKSAGKQELQDEKLKVLVGEESDIETIGALMYSICIDIRNALDDLVSIEMTLDKISEAIKQKETLIETLETELNTQTDKTSHKVKNINKNINEAKNELLALVRRAESLQDSHKTLCFEIYGVNNGEYINDTGATKVNEPAGVRAPDVATLKSLQPDNRDSLYYKFYNKLIAKKVDVGKIELVDDRTIGNSKKGFVTSQTAKLGWKGETPFYATITKIAKGSSS